MKKQLHVIFKGKVQGVGFRRACQRLAERLHLTGFARNLPSGEVELLTQGEKVALDTMLHELKSLFSITESEEHFSGLTQTYDDFLVF